MTRETDQERARRLAAEARSGRTLDRAAYVRHSRRSFLTGAVGVATAALGWRWIQTQPTDDGIPSVLRRGHELNHELWSRIPGTPVSAKEFPRSAVTADLQLNGSRGLESPIDLDAWRLTVEGPRGEVLDELVLDDVVAMGDPVDMTTLHKCIEGWSQVANWTGIRFSDFAARYADRVGTAGFVYLATPDAAYYVGLERASMLNPQTLLAHELNGAPLTLEHGAPLRLYTPNHYGIKSLKRIGRIRFTNEKPPDFWAERSYDWYSRL